MKLRTEAKTKVIAVDAPAGEGARGLPHILLGIAAQALACPAGLSQHEQLHHLAGEILVRRLAAAVGAVQVHQHRRVAGHGFEQSTETSKRVLAQHALLLPHGLRTHHFELRGGEVVVPEQHHALGQRRRRLYHFAQPPGLERKPLAKLLLAGRLLFFTGLERGEGRRRRRCHEGGRRVDRLRRPRLRQQRIDHLGRIPTHDLLDLGLGRRKAGAYEQVPRLTRCEARWRGQHSG